MQCCRSRGWVGRAPTINAGMSVAARKEVPVTPRDASFKSLLGKSASYSEQGARKEVHPHTFVF
jgi:hypothetical protein